AAAMAAEGAQCIVERRGDAERTLWVTVIMFALIGGSICVLRWFAPQSYLELISILAGKFLPPSQFVPLALDTYWKAQRLVLLLGALSLILVLRRSVLGPRSAALLLIALVAADLASLNRNLNISLSWPSLRQNPLLIDPVEVHENGRRIFHYQLLETPD